MAWTWLGLAESVDTAVEIVETWGSLVEELEVAGGKLRVRSFQLILGLFFRSHGRPRMMS
jgi:hypothetical protein